MLVNRANITEKNYKKLAVRIGQDGFSFCITDTLNNNILSVDEVDFASAAKSSSPEENFWKAFVENPVLTKSYDEIAVVHENCYNSFVPTALFDEHYLGSYLQYNTKVFESDFFTYDELPNYEMNNVYIPFVNINNFLIDQYGTFDYRHTSSVLVSKLLDMSKNIDERQVFAHFDRGRFELVIVQNQKLLLFNSFEYQAKEDFIYYLLFAAEQLSLNPEIFKLQLLGNITEDSEIFRIAFKYIRNVSLLDVSGLQSRNTLSAAENLKHFILFQS